MYNILKLFQDNFSIYGLFLIFICALMLVFIDAKQLKKAGLKRESSIAFVAGIIYVAAGFIILILTQIFTPIR